MAAKLCNVCNIRRPKTGSKGTETSPDSDMCNYCWEEGGMENQHSDHAHDAILAEVQDKGGDPASYLSETDAQELDFMKTCWICHPELNLAQKPAQASSTGPKAQGTRRPQLNHKGHSHPATPAARRECKKAFWASLTPVANVSSNEQLAQAMQAWDCQLDGHGKPVKAKSGWAGVHPKGKTRSVQSTGK